MNNIFLLIIILRKLLYYFYNYFDGERRRGACFYHQSRFVIELRLSQPALMSKIVSIISRDCVYPKLSSINMFILFIYFFKYYLSFFFFSKLNFLLRSVTSNWLWNVQNRITATLMRSARKFINKYLNIIIVIMI